MSTTALFAGLIDDAAMFPPGNAPLPEAVDNHQRHRAAWYSPLIGPLLCPASRVDELTSQAQAPLPVRLVMDTGAGGIGPAVDAVASDDRLILSGVEIALPPEDPVGAARRAVSALDAAVGGLAEEEPAFIEPARAPAWRGALEVVAEAGYRAKFRTGGTTADAFPSESEVAEFIVACLDLGIAFKCTAGLHHAVRRTDADDSEQHGFLNILAAVCVCLDGGDTEAASTVLAERDAAGIVSRLRGLDSARASQVRRWFASYGSCKIREPLDDLIALDLIQK